MSDCCTTSSGFPTAATMQQLSTNLPTIWSEICRIQQEILAASSPCQVGGGQRCTTISGTPMTFVTGVETVTVTHAGAGYVQDSPAVVIVPPNGAVAASGATATVTTNGSSVLSINIVTPGSGYQPILSSLSISSVAGQFGVLTPLVNAAGNIVGISIDDPGVGYTTADSIIPTRAVLPSALYTPADLRITSVSVTGAITGVAVVSGGSGFQPSTAEVNIVSTLNPLMQYPLGSGMKSTVLTDSAGAVTQVIVTTPGAGYAVFPPYLVIQDVGTGAVTQTTVNNAGAITGISVITAGSGYTSAATGTVFNPPTAPTLNPPVDAAIVTVNIPVNTFGTDPQQYYRVWAGIETNASIQAQIAAVTSHFVSLGYTFTVLSNPTSGNTLMWKVCW